MNLGNMDDIPESAVRAVARRLKHYIDIQRREEGFDTSGPLNPLGQFSMCRGLGGTLHYNSLQDKHLRHYFQQPLVRKHLEDMGVVHPGMLPNLDKKVKGRKRSKSAGHRPSLIMSDNARLMETSAKLLLARSSLEQFPPRPTSRSRKLSSCTSFGGSYTSFTSSGTAIASRRSSSGQSTPSGTERKTQPNEKRSVTEYSSKVRMSTVSDVALNPTYNHSDVEPGPPSSNNESLLHTVRTNCADTDYSNTVSTEHHQQQCHYSRITNTQFNHCNLTTSQQTDSKLKCSAGISPQFAYSHNHQSLPFIPPTAAMAYLPNHSPLQPYPITISSVVNDLTSPPLMVSVTADSSSSNYHPSALGTASPPQFVPRSTPSALGASCKVDGSSVVTHSVGVSTTQSSCDAGTQTPVHVETQTEESLLMTLKVKQKHRSQGKTRTEKGHVSSLGLEQTLSKDDVDPKSIANHKDTEINLVAVTEEEKNVTNRETLVNTYIHQLVSDGNCDKLKELLQVSPSLVNCINEQGYTPLHVACQNGEKAIVEVLVSTPDVNLHVETPPGYTSMHYAALNGHISCLELLSAKNCSVNCSTVDSQTPLHLATMSGHVECCKWLVENNAELEAKDSNERTPCDIAKEYNRQEVVKLFFTLAKKQ